MFPLTFQHSLSLSFPCLKNESLNLQHMSLLWNSEQSSLCSVKVFDNALLLPFITMPSPVT